MQARRRTVWTGALALVFAFMAGPLAADTPGADNGIHWIATGATGESVVVLYFFWSKHCPHCLRARPFVERLAAEKPWLHLHSLELTDHPENVAHYAAMARALGQEARSVPAFLFCHTMITGYESAATTGVQLTNALLSCHRALVAREPTPAPAAASGRHTVTVPGLGAINLEQLSLPALTVILAGLDSFNPCAFFVLLFLLSLLTHAHSRGRMLTVGGVFVFFSGLVYFLFMAAWLNLFMVAGKLEAITVAAGLLAVGIGLINVKDYFWFNRGASLSIPDVAKPGLYQRVRAVASAGHGPAMLIAAVVLAVAANTYELLCTAGFPMVFTRALTLHHLSGAGYYFYLVLYNVVYVIPLLVIVAAFAITLGSHKLQVWEGRVLKLLSGLMMAGLGAVMLIRPALLNNAVTALALLAVAAGLTYLVIRLSPIRR